MTHLRVSRALTSCLTIKSSRSRLRRSEISIPITRPTCPTSTLTSTVSTAATSKRPSTCQLARQISQMSPSIRSSRPSCVPRKIASSKSPRRKSVESGAKSRDFVSDLSRSWKRIRKSRRSSRWPSRISILILTSLIC